MKYTDGCGRTRRDGRQSRAQRREQGHSRSSVTTSMPAKAQAFVNGPAKGKAVASADDARRADGVLERPRRILMMVPGRASRWTASSRICGRTSRRATS